MSGIGTSWRWLFGLVTVVGLSAAACGDSDDGTDTEAGGGDTVPDAGATEDPVLAQLQAEIDMGLWCGTVCAVFLTYEAELANDQWTITDTVEPIAVS
ncbi:MAG: hypothetical protein P8N02_10920 [Actinomycetota bacterium]|nr:hypothetical protein [Actinomycetota bacterium]